MFFSINLPIMPNNCLLASNVIITKLDNMVTLHQNSTHSLTV